MSRYNKYDAIQPLIDLFVLVMLPFYYVYWKVQQWRCNRDGGHDWENDWGSDGESYGTVIEEYDYCEDCPASRVRYPNKTEGNQ